MTNSLDFKQQPITGLKSSELGRPFKILPEFKWSTQSHDFKHSEYEQILNVQYLDPQ